MSVAIEIVFIDDVIDLFFGGVHTQDAHRLRQFLSGLLSTSNVMLPSPLMSNLLKIFRICSSSSCYSRSALSIF
jgi:hypothetical protein